MAQDHKITPGWLQDGCSTQFPGKEKRTRETHLQPKLRNLKAKTEAHPQTSALTLKAANNLNRNVSSHLGALPLRINWEPPLRP